MWKAEVNHMKNYFRHQLKSNARIIIVIAVLMTLISVFTCLESMERQRMTTFVYANGNYYNTAYYDIDGNPASYFDGLGNIVPITTEQIIKMEYRDLSLANSLAMLVILAMAVPVWMFAFLKKKRNLDCCYSLPITKQGIGLVQYAVGGITVAVPFLCSYISTLICYASMGNFSTLGHGFLAVHFLMSLLLGFVVYSISVFAFERANTVIDGIIFIVAYMVGLFFIIYGVEELYNSVVRHYNEMHGIFNPSVNPVLHRVNLDEESAIPIAFFVNILEKYEVCAETIYSAVVEKMWSDSRHVFWFVFWCVAGVFSAGGAICCFGKKKTECVEEISNSIFGYKLLIPLIGFPIILSEGVLCGSYTTALLVTVGCAVAYTVYRRGVRYKKSDYIILGVMLLLSVIAVFWDQAWCAYLKEIRKG